MTSSIHDSQDLHTPGAPADEPRFSKSVIMRTVHVFTGIATVAGISCLTFAFTHNEWRLGVVGMTITIIACIGGAVMTIDALLADRNEFFNRGKMIGFWEGIHRVPPSADDPLLRR